ncbi:hypothetical protein B7494_g8172 [Chlorociboria aeruginascens]|nr:hypothetical protein B7494_g8172 [Chlorociboria aeruginascens]
MMADVPRRKPMPAAYTRPSDSSYGHSRSRTTSSSIFPQAIYPSPPQPQHPTNPPVNTYASRRTPSTTTFSTIASSGNGPLPFRQSSQDLQRSTSSRSGGSVQPTSYVALMRKQKATVWCDRAQQEDPRILAAQKAAKMRTRLEVVSGPMAGRVSNSGTNSLAGSNRVTAKIRHHGKAGLVGFGFGFSPGDLVGGVGGVPMRLSASEVEGGDSDDDADSGQGGYGLDHRRTGSGRSSVGSGRKGLTYSRQSGASSTGKWSSGNSPPERQDSLDFADAGETPVPADHPRSKDYFSTIGGSRDGTVSTGSGSSGERADHVAELGNSDAARLASNSLLKSTVTREKSVKNPEELRRRGSVDDRAMTLSSGVRLFIANPDT